MKMDKFKEECGIVGVYGHPEAANLAYLGLYALQHRGQESAGIVSSDGRGLHVHRQMGLVADIFNSRVLERLPGYMAIGHVRYSTTGQSELKNAQPIAINFALGGLAIAHNGNLINAQEVRQELEGHGSIFQSTMDTEVIVHLIATSQKGLLVERIIDGLRRVRGSYSLVFITEKQLVAARDPLGFRPLALGKRGGAHLLASETCALDLLEAEYIRDVEPGEIIVIDERGVRSFKPFKETREAFCIFELVYFSRPDSYVFGRSVYAVRKMLGRNLAREHPVEADVVVPVPDSGVPAAFGFAEQAKIPMEMGLIRNHYVGRTFIEPQEAIRHFGVKVKLNPVREVISGKRVVLIDDSIVRGTTSRKIIQMVRNAGAKEVHVRITSPPTISPCYFGIDTPTRAELIASASTVEDIKKYIVADSLGYLSVEGLHAAAGGGASFCDACFTGGYPVSTPWATAEDQLELYRYSGKGR